MEVHPLLGPGFRGTHPPIIDLPKKFTLLLASQVGSFIKYLVNIFETATLSNFENKPIAFTILDFVSTCSQLMIQIYMCYYIIQHHGFPFYII